jgi:hypothetical protein
VVRVIWQYAGLTTEEMEQRVTNYSEYSITSKVSNIFNIESQTLSGIAVDLFQPKVNMDLAIAQIVLDSRSTYLGGSADLRVWYTLGEIHQRKPARCCVFFSMTASSTRKNTTLRTGPM